MPENMTLDFQLHVKKRLDAIMCYLRNIDLKIETKLTECLSAVTINTRLAALNETELFNINMIFQLPVTSIASIEELNFETLHVAENRKKLVNYKYLLDIID